MYIGITAEWNPFHSGHAYMLNEVKKLYPDVPIISAMSGSFVQRGEPAIFDKWTRAKWAILSGADAVIELPVLCVLQSADKFATAAISLLYSLGCTHIAFGAESLSISQLYNAANWSLHADFNHYFHKFLKEGFSYATAINKSMAIYSPTIAQELSRPNNLLGFLYIQTALKQNLSLSFIAIERNSRSPASATAARKYITSKRIYPLLPSEVEPEISMFLKTGHYISYARYEDACLLWNRLAKEESLTKSGLFSEGLEHKWYKETQQNSIIDSLNATKSKRYLYSRLKRIAAALLLSADTYPSLFSLTPKPHYARLLALRNKKSSILNTSKLPIITRVAKGLHTLREDALISLQTDIRATDLQAYCMQEEPFRKGRLDFYNSPIIL